MLTSDLALRLDPIYEKISRRFHENPDQFADAFARAWFKLTHRDMGPIHRYLGPLVPKETLIWQDPIPAVDHPLVDDADIAALKSEGSRVRAVRVAAGLDRMGVGIDVPCFGQARRRQRRPHPLGAAEGLARERARLSWRRCCKSSKPSNTTSTLRSAGGKKVSLADLIVLAGCAAVEKAAKDAGSDVKVTFTPGRMDASQEQTDAASFAPLEPIADGFRNYRRGRQFMAPEEALVDRAQLLKLTGPEMTVLVGGLRVLGANAEGSKHGVFTHRPGMLTNDFFVNLLDLRTEWNQVGSSDNEFEGHDRKTKDLKWTATRVDLIFGSHSQLRALAEVYACADSQEMFVTDFVAAWHKIMNGDRYDLA